MEDKEKTDIEICYENSEDIYNLIVRAYTDMKILETLKNGLPTKGNGIRKMYVLKHICELLKSDFILIVWKIYFDKDSDANTLIHLNNDLCKAKNIRSVTKIKSLSKEYKNMEKVINKFRDKFLAHNTKELSKYIQRLTIPFPILDELIEIYNSICEQHKDLSMKAITKKDLSNIGSRATLGTLELILNNVKQ